MLEHAIPAYYLERRERLSRTHPDAAFVIPCAPETIRNSDVFFPYRQESHFYYLSGFTEAHSCLVILPGGAKNKHRFVMFVQKRDATKELWTGERYGLERARTVFGADESFEFSQLEHELPRLLRGCNRVYFQFNLNLELDRMFQKSLQTLKASMGRSANGILPIFDSASVLGEMRLRKSDEELKLIKEACQATAQAHTQAMAYARAGMSEKDVQSYIEFCFMQSGCERLGYSSIVAGGKNATCLHYVANNERLNPSDLLLIDAAGERGFYTADVTRTFPMGKSFTRAQSELYDIVLEAQKQCITLAKPGNTLDQIHLKAVEVIIDGLFQIKLLSGSKEEAIVDKTYSRFYPHRTSHWLGMDVHDVGAYEIAGSARTLEEGMVFTIEPGIYCQTYDDKVPAEFKGLGIRIEDDILITKDGCENLTEKAVKDKKAIEALRSQV